MFCICKWIGGHGLRGKRNDVGKIQKFKQTLRIRKYLFCFSNKIVDCIFEDLLWGNL